MSFLTVSRLSRDFDLSDPWILRKIKGQPKKLLKAVDEANFLVERGQTYALVGESGSGKSTIAMMVAGLLKPSSGTVTINGDNFFEPSLNKLKRIAMRKSVQMIFQSPYASLNPRWRVGDILKEPIVTFNLIEDENDQNRYVCELLEQVGLFSRDMSKFPHEFSGGQRQRICIARALACKPEIIICDEPTSALDVSVQAQVLNLLKELQQEFSLTYLFIIFNGQRIENNAISVRGSSISMVFQDPLISLNPLRRIGDQLVETIRTHIDLDKTKAITYAKNLLEEVGIDKNRFYAYPHTFSGGMRQRVVIALALAPRPSLIIADEPTTALDVSVQAQILALLKRLCKERGTSIILITHDMGVIAETADRVGVLYSGRLAEIGSSSEVLSNPMHPYTQGLIAATPRIDPETLEKKLYQIPGTMPNLSEIPDGCPFHKRCPKTTPKCFQVKPPLLYDRASCWLLENKTGVI